MPPDAAALVRVSTEASVLQELTSTGSELDAAVESLFVANGWTALWDGIRLGAETLEDAFAEDAPGGGNAFPVVVAFTDGRDNNSADEQDTSYAGDGIDTSLEDLFELEAGGLRVPVYPIGTGDADEEELSELAEATGGAYFDLDDRSARRLQRDPRLARVVGRGLVHDRLRRPGHVRAADGLARPQGQEG